MGMTVEEWLMVGAVGAGAGAIALKELGTDGDLPADDPWVRENEPARYKRQQEQGG